MGGSFMNILLIDILRTSLEEVWPSAEHSLGLMYLSASLKKQFGSKLNIKMVKAGGWAAVFKAEK